MALAFLMALSAGCWAWRVECMAGFEGALFHEWRAYGGRCPLCGGKGVECKRRKYLYGKYGIRWPRDLMSCISGILSWRALERE